MTVVVKLFSVLRERAGAGQLTLSLPPQSTAGDAAAELVRRHPDLAGPMRSAAYAVNRVYCRPEAVLADGDELALIPPVSGG